MAYHYAYQGDGTQNHAKAVGRFLRISTKQSVEIAKYLRGRPLAQAKRLLKEVIAYKRAIPFTRFNRDMGHKSGIAAGRYPINASTHILSLLESAEHNARFKGMNVNSLVVSHAAAQKAGNVSRYGRQGRRHMKYTHFEIVITERAQESGTKEIPKTSEEGTAARARRTRKPSGKKESAPATGAGTSSNEDKKREQ